MLSTLMITRKASARIPTDIGEFQLAVYQSNVDDKEHLAVVMGDVQGRENVLVRIHSECFTGDVLGSLRCDCGEQLQRALELIAQEGRGVILYLRQEGRGIGLTEKLRAYNLQDEGFDTVDANLALGHAADERDYTVAALMLNDLGLDRVQLITNNPAKIESLTQHHVQVSQRVPVVATQLTSESLAYLRTKVARMRHLLNLNGALLRGERPGAGVAGNPTPLDLLAGAPAWAAANGRPRVTLSYAQTLDGAISTQRGQPTVISGPSSLELTHRLRARHDGILVGIETVLSDDPRLNVRHIAGPDPMPVILDSRLRIPITARLLAGPPYPIIATLAGAPEDKCRALERAGAMILPLPADDCGRVALLPLLSALHARGIESLMVEGGATVIRSFLRERLADQAIVTIALRLMGGYHLLGGHQPGMQFIEPQHRQFENDLVVWGELAR